MKFAVRTFDANGRMLGEVPAEQVKWAIGQLTIPPPPPRPAMPKPETRARRGDLPAAAEPEGRTPSRSGRPGRQGAERQAGRRRRPRRPDRRDAAGRRAAAAPATGADQGRQPAGRSRRRRHVHGREGASGPHQAGAIEATVAGVDGRRPACGVFPPLPWKFDFEQAPVGKPPLTWLGAGGKFAVVEDPRRQKNKVLQKLFDIDLYYRARTNFGAVDMTGLHGPGRREGEREGDRRAAVRAGRRRS